MYTGADGYASVTFVVDEDALSNKLLGKKADDDKKYYVRKFIESIYVYTTDTCINAFSLISILLLININTCIICISIIKFYLAVDFITIFISVSVVYTFIDSMTGMMIILRHLH